MKQILILLTLMVFALTASAQTSQGSQLQRTYAKSLDYYYGKTVGGIGWPWASTTEANSTIPITRRYDGMTILVGADSSVSKEYWYHGGRGNSNLILKVGDTTDLGLANRVYVDGAIAAIPTGSGLALVHYWNFNDNSSDSLLRRATISFGGRASITHVAGGTSAIDYANGTGQGYSDSNFNSRNADSAGTHFRFNNPIGGELIFAVSTKGFTNPIFKFVGMRSGSGAGTQTWAYSTNGTTYSTIATVTVPTVPTLQTIDLSAIAAADNNDSFKMKVTFTQGGGGTGGNNRFDNITLDGTPMLPSATYVVAGSGISITGNAPNYTITSTGGGGSDSLIINDDSLRIFGGTPIQLPTTDVDDVGLMFNEDGNVVLTRSGTGIRADLNWNFVVANPSAIPMDSPGAVITKEYADDHYGGGADLSEVLDRLDALEATIAEHEIRIGILEDSLSIVHLPTLPEGIVAWWSADNGTALVSGEVDSWAGRVGDTLVAASSTTRPVYHTTGGPQSINSGGPYLEWNGTQNMNMGADSLELSTVDTVKDVTVFMVMRRTANSIFFPLFQYGPSYNDSNGFLCLNNTDLHYGTIEPWEWGNIGHASTKHNIVENEWHYVNFNMWKSSDYTGYNGIYDGDSAREVWAVIDTMDVPDVFDTGLPQEIADNTNTYYPKSVFSLGGWNLSGDLAHADIAEMIIFNRKMTYEEREVVRQYLWGKYGDLPTPAP